MCFSLVWSKWSFVQHVESPIFYPTGNFMPLEWRRGVVGGGVPESGGCPEPRRVRGAPGPFPALSPSGHPGGTCTDPHLTVLGAVVLGDPPVALWLAGGTEGLCHCVGSLSFPPGGEGNR